VINMMMNQVTLHNVVQVFVHIHAILVIWIVVPHHHSTVIVELVGYPVINMMG